LTVAKADATRQYSLKAFQRVPAQGDHNMNSKIKMLALIGLFLFSVIAARSDGQKDDSFFNRKDLTGWEGLSEFWSVKDGCLIGSTFPNGLKFNTFLCSTKKYKDFELHFQVRLKGPTANSGVQIRSEVFDPKHFAVKGPQCDMGQIYWGSLYGEHFGGMMQQAPVDIVKRVLKPNEFNDYYIKCIDKHVTIKLNGETTVDKDFDNLPADGIIAWQLHQGRSMEATFKDIQFKELNGK
jgi:hypothetical protein